MNGWDCVVQKHGDESDFCILPTEQEQEWWDIHGWGCDGLGPQFCKVHTNTRTDTTQPIKLSKDVCKMWHYASH